MSAESSEPVPSRPGISFQSRITVVAMLTAVAVLLAACAAFIAEQWRTDQRDRETLQTAVIEVFAHSQTIRGAIADRTKAPGAIARLRQIVPEVRAVYILDRDGRVIDGSGPATPAMAAARGLAEVRANVIEKNQVVGGIVSFTDLPSIWSILPRYLALTAALFFAATGLALFLGRWLAGRVTEPVDRLSKAMHAVAGSADFSQRVERSSDDELGRLTDGFNDLLAKLQANDHALRATMAELVEARDVAESANNLKSQFLANMSHEIRTPLNGLLAMTQVMALEDLSKIQRERLDVIRQSGEALLAILNDVLDVSKIEAGKLELEVEDFETEALFRSTYAAFTPLADRKGLALALDIGPGAAGVRRGDAARLRQIANNLISNALKFTQEGEVRITIGGIGGIGADGAEGLQLTVADTGIGIPPEALPQLFQKFTQADSSTTRRFGGTGLGLAICHDLTELMGGRIWVESEEGRGSSFHVLLPLPRAVAETPADSAADPQPAGAEEHPIRVLAAEDNATNQLVLSTIMQIFGVELSMVDDGRKAVEAWRTGDFDLILMDIQMPEMDGLSATRAIRAAESETGRKRIPIVALSAHAMTHQVKEYLAAGIDLHVPKPIELPKLQAALETALSMAEAEDEVDLEPPQITAVAV